MISVTDNFLGGVCWLYVLELTLFYLDQYSTYVQSCTMSKKQQLCLDLCSITDMESVGFSIYDLFHNNDLDLSFLCCFPISWMWFSTSMCCFFFTEISTELYPVLNMLNSRLSHQITEDLQFLALYPADPLICQCFKNNA